MRCGHSGTNLPKMNLLRCLLVLGFAGRLLADSGGPYEFVPDLRPEEHAPTNAIEVVVPKVAAGPPGPQNC